MRRPWGPAVTNSTRGRLMTRPRAMMLIVVLAANGLAGEPQRQTKVPPPGPQEWRTFENGVRVLLAPYMHVPGVLPPQASAFLIVSCYGTGILHEPEGLAGVTRLIEKIRPAPGELPALIEWEWFSF